MRSANECRTNLGCSRTLTLPPATGRREGLCSDLEVSVVVEQCHIMGVGKGGDQEVGHADGTMTTGVGQRLLRIQCRLPVLIVGRQVLVCEAAI